MKIIVAETAGFCWGVRKAMDKTLDLIHQNDYETISTLGPLIHNRQVVEMLSDKGVEVVESPDDFHSGKVIIRAHGTTPEILRKLKQKKIDICNATCPKVGKVQGIIKGHVAKGYDVVIIGDEGHAEVTSLYGYSGNIAHIINAVSQAECLPSFNRVVVVSQTTFNNQEFDDIAEVIRSKSKEAKVFCTICDSTHRRQAEVRKIAAEVDCMIIVGGKHSANTVRLAEIASKIAPAVFHIEGEHELEELDLSAFSSIGVSAGASTPNWIISSVVNYLNILDKKDTFSFKLKGWLVISGLYRSLSACILSAGVLGIAGFELTYKYPLIAFLYIYAMTALNNIIDFKSFLYSDPAKYYFIRMKKPFILLSAVLALLVMAVPVLSSSLWTMILVFGATMLGIFYRVRFKLMKRVYRIFDIPGSKNLIHALAWTLVIGVLPVLSPETSISPIFSILICTMVFVIIFTGSILFDIRDIQGDKFMGRETLPMLLGVKVVSTMTYILNCIVFILVIIYSLNISHYMLSGLSIIVGSYTLVCIYQFSALKKKPRKHFEFFIDGIAIVYGLAGVISSLVR